MENVDNLTDNFESTLMNEITIPFHLAIPTLLCLGILLLIFIKRQRLFHGNRRKWVWISIVVFLSIYILIVGDATIVDISYQLDLNKYDLDKDGFFGGAEITKGQQAAMQRLTNDVGRNFSIFTGFIFSGIISLTVYLVGLAFEKYKKLKEEEKTTHNSKLPGKPGFGASLTGN